MTLTITGLKANGWDATAIASAQDGNSSATMLNQFEREVLSRKPDWIVLSCGLNDVRLGAAGVPLESFKTNVTAMIEKAQTANIKVILQTPTISEEDLGNVINLKLATYQECLRVLAQEKHCPLADIHADFRRLIKAEPRPGRLLTLDGVRLNTNGQQVVARGILRALGLTEAQIVKAEEAWLDLPNTVQYGVAFRGNVTMSLRQQRQFSALAAANRLTIDQLVKILYGAEFAGGASVKTCAELEVFLGKREAKDPEVMLQEGLTRRADLVKGAGMSLPVVEVARFWHDRKGAVSLTWDDGFASHYKLVAPLLDKYGLHGTFFIVAGKVNDWAPWKAIAEHHEIGNHSMTHARLEGSMTPAVLEREIVQAARIIADKIGVAPVSFGYPYSSTTPEATKVVLATHVSGRGGGAPINQESLDNAALSGKWLVGLVHDVEAKDLSGWEDVFKLVQILQNVLWVDTYGKIGTYVRMRDNVRVTVAERAVTRICFSLELPADMDCVRFHAPLTMKIAPPKDVPVAAVAMGARGAPLETCVQDGCILVDVVPGSGPVTVTWN